MFHGFGIRWRFSAPLLVLRGEAERVMKKSGVGILIVVDASPVA